jgi:hypothetical protein
MRLSRYEITILTSVLVESADTISGELPFLRGDAAEEGKRLRVALNAVIARLMDLR